MIYCNDGNYYCDVLNWDWTKQAARDLYTSHVLNATTQGSVDGIFADHATVRLSNKNNQICNGKGDKRTCYYFEPEFAAAFDAGHEWIVNHTQDMLASCPFPSPFPTPNLVVFVCLFGVVFLGTRTRTRTRTHVHANAHQLCVAAACVCVVCCGPWATPGTTRRPRR